MVATEPGEPEKMSIFRKVSESLEKSGENVEKPISQRKVKGLFLGYFR